MSSSKMHATVSRARVSASTSSSFFMLVIRPPAREVDVHPVVLEGLWVTTGASDCAVTVASGCVVCKTAAALLFIC